MLLLEGVVEFVLLLDPDNCVMSEHKIGRSGARACTTYRIPAAAVPGLLAGLLPCSSP